MIVKMWGSKFFKREQENDALCARQRMPGA